MKQNPDLSPPWRRVWNWTILKIGSRIIAFLFLLVVIIASFDYSGIGNSFHRSSFPSEFVFGAASSSYQYEGAAREGGKGPSIWDTFAHRHPEMIFDGSNGDVAEDFYHRYKKDIQNLKKMGMDAFRFSISWSRILPNGSLSGGINKQGIKFYNNLIDELLANDLKPFVTIFHWDLPQAIEDKYEGFLSKHILRDYLDYAEVCFKEFGDRVKHWITFNEPVIFCSRGYASGLFAPGRCSPWEAGNCTVGDSGTEPYIAAHNILIAHSSIVKLYRDKYQSVQKGNIGMTLATHWFMPYSSSIDDVNAASRSIDLMFGWFLGPLTYGEYPNSMRDYLGTRLPKFTKEESELLKESYDFLGINYYATFFSRNDPDNDTLNKSYDTDSRTIISGDDSNGIQLPLAYSTSSFYINPPGIRDLVVYTKNNYKNPVIYITENGVAQLSNSSLSLNEALEDDIRISYHRDHLFYLNDAIGKGVDVRGYFAWSFMDDFEWSSGYSHRFGLYYVDYNNNLKRYPKKSVLWFTKFLRL